MNYQVLWLPSAERDLADLWVDSSNRETVRWAANEIDDVLERDPLTAGESREDNSRIK